MDPEESAVGVEVEADREEDVVVAEEEVDQEVEDVAVKKEKAFFVLLSTLLQYNNKQNLDKYGSVTILSCTIGPRCNSCNCSDVQVISIDSICRFSLFEAISRFLFWASLISI